jgi:hypothetical protein
MMCLIQASQHDATILQNSNSKIKRKRIVSNEKKKKSLALVFGRADLVTSANLFACVPAFRLENRDHKLRPLEHDAY